MAKIPTLSDAPRVSMNVPRDPTLSPQEASAGSRNAAALSGQVAQSLGRLRQQQINEANKVSYTKSQIEFSKKANEEIRQLELDFQGSNFDGFSQTGLDSLKRRKEEVLKTAPEGIREQLALDFDAKMVRFEDKLKSVEANNKSQFAIYQTQDMMKSASKDSYSSWNPQQNLETTLRLKDTINSSKQYDTKTKRALAGSISDISKDMVTGVIDRGELGEMQTALNDLTDKSMSPMFSEMDPQDKTRAIARLENKIKSKQREEQVISSSRYDKAINSLLNGTLNPDEPEGKEALNNLETELIRNFSGEEHQGKLKTMRQELAIYKKVGSTYNDSIDVLKLDVSKSAESLFESEKDPIEKAAGEARAKKVLGAIVSKRQKEFNESPIDYFNKHDKSLATKAFALMSNSATPEDYRSYVTSVDALSDRAGVSKVGRKYFPKGLADHFSKPIKASMESGNFQGAEKVMEDLDNLTDGQMWRHYSELGIDLKTAVVMEANAGTDRANMLRNLKEYDEGIMPRYKAVEDKMGDTEIRTMLQKDPFFQSMAQINGGDGSFADRNAAALLDVGMMEYKRLRLKNYSEDQAKEQAFAAFKANYEVAENGNYPIPVRKGQGYDVSNIQGFAQHFKAPDGMVDGMFKDTPNYYEDLGARVKDGVDSQGNPTYMSAEKGNKFLAERARIIYDKGSDSMQVIAINDKGDKFTVRDKDNKPLVISMKDADKLWADKEQDEATRKRMFLKRNMGTRSINRLMR